MLRRNNARHTRLDTRQSWRSPPRARRVHRPVAPAVRHRAADGPAGRTPRRGPVPALGARPCHRRPIPPASTAARDNRPVGIQKSAWAGDLQRSVAPLIPDGKGGKRPGRPPKHSRRQLLDGIRWRDRVGAPWRDVPERYGHWPSIYGMFRCWQRAGVWRRVWITLLGFADAAGLIYWQLSVDSTINRDDQPRSSTRCRCPSSTSGSAGRAAWGRTTRSRVGPFPRRSDHEDSSGV